MDLLQSVVNYILNLGPSVFVGGIMIIIGLIVKMKAKDAISAGITLGVAFTGMSLLIGFMMGAIGPAATAMVENTGIALPILDGGWTTLATLAWSWPYAFVMFPVVIGVNIIMLVLNKTNTIKALLIIAICFFVSISTQNIHAEVGKIIYKENTNQNIDKY
jgi:PTS system galactitol-specific IIC component